MDMSTIPRVWKCVEQESFCWVYRMFIVRVLRVCSRRDRNLRWSLCGYLLFLWFWKRILWPTCQLTFELPRATELTTS